MPPMRDAAYVCQPLPRAMTCDICLRTTPPLSPLPRCHAMMPRAYYCHFFMPLMLLR